MLLQRGFEMPRVEVQSDIKRGKRLLYLVEVHQLHLVVGDLLLVGALEHEGDGVSLVLSLNSDDVVVGSTPRLQVKFGTRKTLKSKVSANSKPENLGHAGEVHSHAESPVASEFVEPVGTQIHGHQRHVGVVHRLVVNDHHIALSVSSEKSLL